MLQASEDLPLTVLVNAPSCVPATELATAGAKLDADDLSSLRTHPRVAGLAEVMNVPEAVLGAPGVLAKLDAFAGRPVDGHAPGVTGAWLNAYAAAGIATDHECITADEAREKLAMGMRVLIREGTGAKNLRGLLAAVTPATARRCAFCTDDRHPHDLLDEGSIDHLVRAAISLGMDPVTAIQLATLNGAETFGLRDRGGIAPGQRADLVVLDNLEGCQACHVLAGGRWIVRDGALTEAWTERSLESIGWPSSSVRIPLDQLDLTVPARGDTIRVIGLVPEQIVTEHRTLHATVEDGRVVADPARDLAHLVVIERHHGTGAIGHGFVQGLGLKTGAIASTVAHDHHNLIVAAMDDSSLRTAIATVIEAGGGLAACQGDDVLATMPLPIAGLMSDRSLEATRRELDALIAASRQLGATVQDPFMSLSFLGLEVIPSLKLTDRGLVDVDRFELVDLFVAW
jgi:adenine deaminase